jgi:PKD repeat protein
MGKQKSFRLTRTLSSLLLISFIMFLTAMSATAIPALVKDTNEKSVKAPIAAFDLIPSSTTPLTIKFIDHSTGLPTSWTWNFGDKITSTVRNPVHKYSKAGKYTVSLTVKNAVGSNTLTIILSL